MGLLSLSVSCIQPLAIDVTGALRQAPQMRRGFVCLWLRGDMLQWGEFASRSVCMQIGRWACPCRIGSAFNLLQRGAIRQDMCS